MARDYKKIKAWAVGIGTGTLGTYERISKE